MSLDSRALELQFLPAALEIEETPPLPMARVMLWAIVVFFLLAVAWACIGRVDIVGVAPGKIVPSGRTKTIQPLENAVVASIRVAEGQHVEAGEVLVELDPTLPAADRDRLTQERMTLALDRARLSALLEEADSLASMLLPSGVDDASLAQYQASLKAQRHEYEASLQALQEERREKEAARAGVQARIAQLDATLPLITEEAESYQKLMATGMVPRVKWLELERARIEQRQELAVQRQQARELGAGLGTLHERLKATAAQYRARWTTALTEAEAKLDSYDEEIAKAERRLALTSLTAPVAGTVQQLAVHTVGGVVTEAQPLMLLVPDESPIEVEAMVSNKDIGFVREGQSAIVKIETFNFTKYGYVEGAVTKVSHDAVTDKERGLIYTAHIRLQKDRMLIDGNEVKLAPGMAITAEVKMGKRRVIEFLLSPLLRYKQESGRER